MRSADVQVRMRELYPELSERCHRWLEAKGVAPRVLLDLSEAAGLSPTRFLDLHTRTAAAPVGGCAKPLASPRGIAKLSLVRALPGDRSSAPVGRLLSPDVVAIGADVETEDRS